MAVKCYAFTPLFILVPFPIGTLTYFLPLCISTQYAILNLERHLCVSTALSFLCTVQSRFSDIKFSDNLCSDLVTILQIPFFNSLHKIIQFSDIMQFSGSFFRDQKCH